MNCQFNFCRRNHCEIIDKLFSTSLTRDEWDQLNLSISQNKTEIQNNYFGMMDFTALNWHIDAHWLYSAKLFGMPKVFSTARFESKHVFLKRIENFQSNHWNPSLTVTKKTIQKVFKFW